MFKHYRSFAQALPTADFPSVTWVTQSAGQEGLLWILQSNTQFRILQVTYRSPADLQKEPFYFSDLAILFLTTLLNPAYKPCPTFGNDTRCMSLGKRRERTGGN
jgi:hypothetical protein